MKSFRYLITVIALLNAALATSSFAAPTTGTTSTSTSGGIFTTASMGAGTHGGE